MKKRSATVLKILLGAVLLGTLACVGLAAFTPLRHTLPILPAFPGLLGFDTPRTYLIVAQNRDELRATGGFISGLGTLTLSRGRLSSFEIGDSYRVDDFENVNYPTPPEPLQRFMLAGYWVPRDANWSPDFPTAARQLQDLYRRSTNQVTHGVVAFDQSALIAVLEAVGPLQAPGFPEPVTALNVEGLIQAAWAPEPDQDLSQEWWLHRKDFMGQLARAVIQRLVSKPDPGTLLSLGKVSLDLLGRGHLLVYLDDPAAQQALANLGFAGDLRLPAAGDFLLLVDSNLGFNKVDSLILRGLSYRVDLRQPEQPSALVSLYYYNQASAQADCKHEASYGQGTYADMQQRCYWDYWRVYLPGGSRLIWGQGPPVQADWLLGSADPAVLEGQVEVYPGEVGTQVLAGMFVLPSGRQAHIPLQVALPASVLSPGKNGVLVYHLRLQKQPGLDQLPLTLQVHPPTGFQLSNPPAGWQSTTDGSWFITTTLTHPLDLELVFSP